MSLSLRLLIILSSVFAPAAFGQTCEIVQTADSRNIQRIMKIDFPDGRRITLVGHRHGARQEMFALRDIPDSPEMFSQARLTLQSPGAKTALSYFREDRHILRKALQEGAEFVGIETANENVAGWKTSVAAFRDRMLKHSAQTGESDLQLIQDATLSILGAPTAMILEEPGLFRRAKIIGFENDQAGMAELALQPQESAARQVLKDAFEGNPAVQKIFAQSELEFLFLTYANYDPNKPGLDEQVVGQYADLYPPRYQESARNYMKARLVRAKKLYARDAESAKNLLAQNKSGVAFVGAVHLPQIMRRLKNACLSQPRAKDKNLENTNPAQSRR